MFLESEYKRAVKVSSTILAPFAKAEIDRWLKKSQMWLAEVYQRCIFGRSQRPKPKAEAKGLKYLAFVWWLSNQKLDIFL